MGRAFLPKITAVAVLEKQAIKNPPWPRWEPAGFLVTEWCPAPDTIRDETQAGGAWGAGGAEGRDGVSAYLVKDCCLGVGMAAGLLERGTPAEHAVELIHEERDGFVALILRDGGVHVGAVDGDVSLGGEAVGDILFRIALELDAEADDALFMTEEADRFFLHELLEGRCEVEVDAGHDDIVADVFSVHSSFLSGFTLARMSAKPWRMTSIADALSTYAMIIVTGGSSGIGKAFIERVKDVNRTAVICNLSRREPGFEQGQLNLRHVPCDLSNPAQIERAATEVLKIMRGEAAQGKILLVNNSGFGGYGRSEELPRAHQTEMIDVNVRALVDLTMRLLPELKARGGAVVNIASTAAFQPTAFMAVYGATKAFVLHWSLALGEELRGSGVQVLAVCPGPTATEFFNRAGMKKGAVSDQWGQTSEQVVEEALQALARGRRQIVTGWLNWVLAAVSSRLPKPFGARVGAVVLAKFRMSKVNT